MKLDHWRKYQRKIEKWSLKMTAYNKINDFNILETEPYNHVRDIFCLSFSTFSEFRSLNFASRSSNNASSGKFSKISRKSLLYNTLS